MSPALRIAALIFTLYLGFALFLSGCCTERVRIVGLGTPQLIDTAWNLLDTLDGPFNLYVPQELEMASLQPPSVYAFQCGWENLNLIDKSTLRLELDVPLAVGTETIPPDTDLLAHPLTRDLLEAEVYEAWRFDGYIMISFGEAFLASCSLPQGPVSFTFRAATDDGKQFTATALGVVRG